MPRAKGETAGDDRGHERGTTLAETLVVLALSGLILAMTASYSLAWFGREEVRSAAYEIRNSLQLARTQAVNRNHSCRFYINTATRAIKVVDINDPSTTADDITLSTTTLSKDIKFVRPDASTPVTLTLDSGTSYYATFTSDGSVSAGTGVVSAHGGDRYVQVTLYAAGGVKLERWNGTSWSTGS